MKLNYILRKNTATSVACS